MSIENKKIAEEELDNVSGGKFLYASNDKSKYSEYNIPVDPSFVRIGKKYLFESIGSASYWLFGELYNTYASIGFFCVDKIYDIIVMDAGGRMVDSQNRMAIANEGGTYEISGENVQVYAKSGEW